MLLSSYSFSRCGNNDKVQKSLEHRVEKNHDSNGGTWPHNLSSSPPCIFSLKSNMGSEQKNPHDPSKGFSPKENA